MTGAAPPPLARFTSLRVGGPPETFVEPATEAELQAALVAAADRDEPVRALGGGKNVLVADEGVEGTVISLGRLKQVDLDHRLVFVQAGVSLAGLIGRTAAAGLSGLEVLAGIPGTVGGAVRMNAGGSHGEIGERVLWVRGFTAGGAVFRFEREACGFAYRRSGLRGAFITEVALELDPARADPRARAKEILEAKRRSQPLGAATAGCMFKNPDLPGGETAGWLLDRAGLKGLARGGARFSSLHANFVENPGGATCADILALVREGRRRVSERFGVDLELEVEVWGGAATRSLLVA